VGGAIIVFALRFFLESKKKKSKHSEKKLAPLCVCNDVNYWHTYI